jgi:ribonuclease-3
MEKFEEKIGIVFKDKKLLKQALTHRSYINENKDKDLEHNERLEFLGDAVLELVSTDFLFNKFKDKTEGELTSYRSALVNTMTLSKVASELEVNDFLLLSKGESKDTGRARQFILANTYEAIVGAIYLDQGYEVVAEFITKNLLHLTDEIVDKELWQDAKSNFQEMSQEKISITPNYKILKEEGPDHDRTFTVGVYLDEELVAEGEGRSKQEAEQEAAKGAIEKKGW